MAGSAPKVRVQLENQRGERLHLDFTVRNTPPALRWLSCLKEASQARPGNALYKPDQFHNFPREGKKNSELMACRINEVIDRLNEAYGGLIPFQVDPANPQESVNKVHVFFAQYHRDKFEKHGSLEDVWDELNRSLHAYESSLRSQATEKEAGIPEANFLVSWRDPCKKPLQAEDYPFFTVAKKFGTCYANYCQVGRHFYEIFLSQDEILDDDHIFPLRSVSAESYFWFGSTTGPKSLARKNEAIKSWFAKNAEKFNRLGFHWGDPSLAIGWLPVADLAPEIMLLPDQLSLIREMGAMGKVVSLTPLEEA
jgi:hypothetical protein